MRRIITINSNQLDRSIETKKLLSKKLIDAGFDVSYDFHPDAELVISIGGDGSFLKTIHDFDFPEIPIVGINTGHLGFFPEISPNDIDIFIDSYLKRDYILQDIPLLEASICTKKNCSDVFAINEVVVKGDKSRTIHLNLLANDKHIQNLSGDGMIVSTPTGSTAYNYAAGGSIVDPSLNLMQLTPLYPINTNAYRCFTSSIIFSHDTIIKIAPEYRFENSILIVVDGIEYRFSEIDNIQIKVSDVKIQLLRMSNYEFWSRVSEKFL
ncbi:NAD(+)/NADH kinase [Romboutsia weinsteinii]|uniref:NAD kinase n=1 Tax=Romboutsia weinsteinii TaxID=2020949 RepID=A0A371IZK0_9FIRM|nr:NAD(+)/NADH kinase [Romboutsia weinsteinii]RDY25972.1 NAD(+)/NADH kinase [Romboutsia weinsteinii]